MKDLTQFTDYRTYLKEYIKFKKKLGYISNRWFAQRVGINSSSWLTVVLQGKKGVSKATANKISKVLKHSDFEAEYFEALVLFNQAKTNEDRNRYYNQLLGLRKEKRVEKVDENQYEFYATWYHSVVRSLIGLIKFKDDFARLAKMVKPQITPAQAKKSVELLENLDLIKKNEESNYELSSANVTTGDHVRSLAIANYQQETMKQGWEALDRFSKEIRDVSTITMGISEKGFGQIKDEIQAFRKRIIKIATEDEPADRVYQMNLQLFPMGSTEQKETTKENRK